MKDIIPIKITTNTIVQGIGKLITAGTTFLVIVLVRRSLGETLFGEFAKVFALVELFHMGVDFGFNAIVVRSIVKREEEEKFFLGNLFGLRFIWGSFFVFLVILIAFTLPFDPKTSFGFSPLVKFGIFIASLNILSQAFLTSANAAFQIRLRYDQSVLAVSLGAFLKLLIIFFLTQKGFPFLYLVLGLVVAEALTALFAFSFACRLVGSIPILFDKKRMRGIFLTALPLGLTLIFNLVYFRSDTIILSFFRSPTEVGNYALGFRFFEATLVLPIFFSNSIYPLLVESASRSLIRMKKMLLYSVIFLFISSILVSAVLYLLAPTIPFIFRGESSQASFALRLLAFGLPFFYLSAIFMWVLIALEKQILLVPLYGGAATLTLVANLIFIPLFGFVAAALITVFGEALVLLVSIFLTVYFLSKKR